MSAPRPSAPGPSALEQQAAALLHQGRYAAAELLYRQVLASGQATPTALGNLAALCGLQQRWAEALPLLHRQLQLVANQPLPWRNLALALLHLGRPAESIRAYQRAVSLPAAGWEDWFGLANACREHGDSSAAIAAYRRCLELCPSHAQAANNLGGVLMARGDLQEALAAYRQAIAADPGLAEAFNNLAIVLRETRRFEEAIAVHHQALARQPGMAKAHTNLAITLFAVGDAIGARAAFQQAANLAPDDLGIAISALGIDQLYDSEAAISAARQQFAAGLAGLWQRIHASPESLVWDHQPTVPTFYLSYHNLDDRPHLELLHRLIQAQSTPAQPAPSPAPPGTGLRLGLVSGLCRESHVIGHLYGGLLAALAAAEDIELVLLHPPFGSSQLGLADSSAPAIASHELCPEREQAERQIRELHCDLLFYLDVDMVPAIWSLAHARLAPVQVTSWGTPNTSGMASIDYYLSAAAIEPPGADAFYTETLIRLSRLPCIYSPPALAGIRPDRAGLQLPLQGPLIGLPQSLFKLHPSYDAVLERIVRAVPDCWLVLLEGTRLLTARLRERWGSQAPLLLERTLFLPRLSRERYLTLLDTVDVLLDPFYFGSGNSFYEAMAVGTPLVTLPGRFMRGRIVAGGYQQMGLEQQAPIARSAEHYVEWVVQLAADAQLRAQLKATIRTAAQQHLFNDQAIAAEFLEVFRAAIAASRAGSRLPPGWRPAPSRR